MNRLVWWLVVWVAALCGLTMIPAACGCPPAESPAETTSQECGHVEPRDCESLQGVDFEQRCKVLHPGSKPVLVDACVSFSCAGAFASDLVCDGRPVRLWCCDMGAQ